MNFLSDRIQNLSESATIAMSRRSREMREEGHDVISLSLGEPDFYTPELVKEAAKQAIDDNYSHYPPIPGYKDLREAISAKLKRENDLDYQPSQIVVSTGAKQSIANIVLCLINPGDEVLLPVPYWVTYHEIVKLAGGVPVKVNTTLANDFKVTEKQLAEACTERTRLVIFSSPCNPSGSVFDENDLAHIARFLKNHSGIMAIADEIYEYINFKGRHYSLASFADIKDQVATVNGLSKGFAMTGWRIGYMAGPQWLADACTKMQGQFTSAASSISQRAAIAALQANRQNIEEMKEAFLKRRNLVLELLAEVPGFENKKHKGGF